MGRLAVILPVGAAIALVWANTAAFGYADFAASSQFVVNAIGMTLFFAVAAKEVVDAMAPGGALHTWRRAAVPVIAAAGGMLAPALIFVAIAVASHKTLLLRGWAIPSATDIAFSYVVARAIFGRHPAVSFLLLLAIVDDAIGLILLAVAYPTAELHLVLGCALMAAALAIAAALRWKRVASFWPYLLAPGVVSWFAFFRGGFHPALAFVPIVPFIPGSGRDAMEHDLTYPVQIVLFLFALTNAGVRFEEIGTGTWAVLAAMLLGKPLGIVAACRLAVAGGLRLPDHLKWRDVVVVGFVGAIGFTVALFFATAAFPDGPMLNETKLGALLSLSGSLAAFAAAWTLKVGRYARARRP